MKSSKFQQLIGKKTKLNSKRRTTGTILIGVIAVILAGALLLMLPVSNKSGEWGNPIDALFTAVSATCVTGLVTVDTALT